MGNGENMNKKSLKIFNRIFSNITLIISYFILFLIFSGILAGIGSIIVVFAKKIPDYINNGASLAGQVIWLMFLVFIGICFVLAILILVLWAFIPLEIAGIVNVKRIKKDSYSLGLCITYNLLGTVIYIINLLTLQFFIIRVFFGGFWSFGILIEVFLLITALLHIAGLFTGIIYCKTFPAPKKAAVEDNNPKPVTVEIHEEQREEEKDMIIKENDEEV